MISATKSFNPCEFSASRSARTIATRFSGYAGHFILGQFFQGLQVAAKKQRGEVLGNPTNIAQAAQAGRRVQTAKADRFAANLLPIIRSIQSAGPIGMVSIAKLMNERGIRTARGGQWHVSSVANLLARANNCAAG